MAQSDPENVWPKGSMRFIYRREIYISKAGETPSMFLCRIIRDRDGDGAQLWSYLCEEMGNALEEEDGN